MSNIKELDEYNDHGTTTTTAYDEKTDVYSTDDLLRAEGSGCLGAIEKIPLPIKLIVMIFVSLLGLVFFGLTVLVYNSIDVRHAREVKTAAVFMRTVGYYLTNLQYERAQSGALLLYNGTIADIPDLQDYMDKVDNYRSQVKNTYYPMLKSKYGDEFTSVIDPLYSYYESSLLVNRQRVLNKTVTATASVDFYTAMIAQLIKLQSKMLALTELGSQGHNYVYFTRLIEAEEYRKSVAFLVFSTRRVQTRQLVNYSGYKALADSLRAAWKESAPASIQQVYNETIIVPSITQEADAYILDLTKTTYPAILPIVPDPAAYARNMSLMLDTHRAVNTYLLDKMYNDQVKTVNRSVTIIVVFTFLEVVFTVLSIVTAIVFATTIIGPWVRLNRIQEAAISRFVPKGLLKMLRCERITDVQLGKFVQKDLTIVEVEIKDFDRLCQNLKSDQMFHMVNEYLKFVGPLVRRHGGFVEKYQGEKFTALFKDPTNGVRLSLDIQNAMETFNDLEQFPKMGVGSSVHCDTGLLGIVGEDERMDGAIVSSSHKYVKTVLNPLAIRFNARTLITRNVLEKFSSSMKKRAAYRYLGSINTITSRMVLSQKNVQRSTSDADVIRVYEVIQPSDTSKIGTKTVFETGVVEFQKGFYTDAIKHFSEVLNVDPQDSAAVIYLNRAHQLQNQTRLICNSLQVKDILTDRELLDNFNTFCASEHSEENISLWRKIDEEFKRTANDADRLECAKKLCQDYFALDGICPVNINENMKQKVMNKIANNQSEQIDRTLFNEVALELELLMSTDTVARYKTTEGFKAAFQKSNLCLKQPLLDEL
jgi:hypothetical protein